MVRFDTPEGGERSQQRQCWLAMRAAYQTYRQASALAHTLADDLSNDPASSDKAIQLQTATLDQRTAFETYIEARLQFLESSCDRSHRTGEHGGPRTKLFVCVVGVLTLGFSTWATLGLSRDRRQIDDLNRTERETNISINETRQGLQALSDRVPPNLAASMGSDVGSSEAPQPSKRLRPPSGRVTRPIASLVRTRRYAYRDFSVSISTQFARVGPIRISVRSVDRRAQKVNLCVASGTATFCKNDVRAYEWLSIGLADPPRRIDLYISRVGPSRIQGYFRTPGSWSPVKVNAMQTH